MKIRTGFVSNSSSSSFIVAFYEEPTIESLKEWLYGNQDKIPYEYNSIMKEEIFFDTTELATQVFNSLKKYDPKDFSKYSTFERELNEIVKLHNTNKEEALKMYKEKILRHIHYDEVLQIEEFAKDNDRQHIYVCEFGDDDDIGAQLEHGDTFQFVTHLRFSHH